MKKDDDKSKKDEDLNEAEIQNLLKQYLLKLLKNDKNIQDAIILVASNDQENSQSVKEKEAEINVLREEISKQQIKCTTIVKQLEEENNKNRNSETIIKQLTKDKEILDREKKDISLAMEEYKKKYSFIPELDEVYNIYNALPQNLKISMAGFINGDSLLSFLMSGARDSKIEKFWDYCRVEVQKNNGLQYSREIAIIFKFFFAKINFESDTSLYKLYEPAIGVKFDDNSMILSNSSPIKTGIISLVIFPGYSGTKTGKIIQKAIVTLGGDKL